MSKNTIGLYFIDNNIYICGKNITINETIKDNIIKYNRIADSDEFYKCLNNIIKKNKLGDTFSLNTVLVVEHPNFLKSDKELITRTLEKLFNKVKFIHYDSLLPDTLTLTINKNSIVIPDKQIIFDIDYNSFNLKEYLKNSDKIFLIGNNDNIVSIADLIERKYKIKVYWLAQHELFIINNLLKEITMIKK